MRNFFIGKNKLTELGFLIIFLTAVSCAYSVISVQSHNHFETFGWDLGYFDQLIWKISQGIFPYSTLSHVNLFAGHFAPILYLYAPLYYLWSDPRMLLIVQSFLMVFAALPLYFLSKSKTKSVIFSLSVTLAYLFFQGTQWSILNEFHEATITPLFIILLFFALEKKKVLLLLLSALGLLATKEEMALLLFSLAVPVYFYFRHKKLSMILGIVSFFIFFSLILFFMPKISESGIYYQEKLSPDTRSPVEFITKILTQPSFFISSFFTPPQKIYIFIISFLSFSLLPFFAPWPILIPLFEQFFMRFIYTGPQFTFWQNVNHHAAPSAMLLSIACIYGAVNIVKIPKNKYFKYPLLAGFLIITTLTQDILLKNPIHSLFKTGLFRQEDWMKNNEEIIKQIPSKVSVAAQNNLFPHLSQRREIFLLPELGDAEYAVFDFSQGSNKFSPSSRESLKIFMDGLLVRHQYYVKSEKGEAILLEKTDFAFNRIR